MYRVHTNEEIEKFVNMYIFCDISLVSNPLQNAQQHNTLVHVRKKIMFFVEIITHCLLCVKQKL
jgi:hypothetical protein